MNLAMVLSIWESDPWTAIIIVCLCLFGIAAVSGVSGILISRNMKQKQLINEAEVRRVKERLERIIGMAPVLFSITVDSVIVEINENLKDCTGLIIGDNISRLYAKSEDMLEHIRRIETEGVMKSEVTEFVFTDGVHRCLVGLAATDYDGKAAIVGWSVDIEQSETQRDQLSTARQSLQTVLDSLPISVRITDCDNYEIAYANNACLKMFNYSSDEINKLSVMNVVPEMQSDGRVSRLVLQEMLSSYDPISRDLEYLTADGKIIDARSTICRIDYNGRAAALGIITDLAKERESQRVRRDLQTVLDMLPVSIRILDADTMRISYANKAAADMFGLESSEQAYGMSNMAFVAEVQRDGSSAASLLANIKPTSMMPVSTELLLRKADGTTFEALVTACLIDYNGTKSSLGVVQDLTEEKEFQQKLAGIAEREREANQLKSRFLVNMSHEIRTPMNVIIGLTEIELRKDRQDNSKDIYKKINMSAKNLLAIINDILDLSKIEANKVVLYEENFELEEVLNSALLVASPRLDGKNAEFMLSQTLDMPRYVVGDRTRLWQILKNFLDNAAKYTDGGNIVLSVFVDNERSDDETVTIQFIIEDTGIGMDEEQMQRIFMPYEQVYNNAQKKYTGTGLGMVISKHLCELMGGTLQVESSPGVGTVVHFSIPFKRSANRETELQLVNPQSLAGVNVLAVDDDKLALDIMERLLRNSGATYTTAQSGAEAMKVILEHRDNGKSFDLILLDYMMNGLNGLDTARQINSAVEGT